MKVNIKIDNEDINRAVKANYLKARELVTFLLENKNITIKKEHEYEDINKISISKLLYDNMNITKAMINLNSNTIVLELK